CILCGQGNADKDMNGHKVILHGMNFHAYCMKFSAGIFQQENISEDIFLPDIILAIRKIENTHCFVCGKRGASISCAQAGCDRSFHLPCASEGECVTQYFDTFRSFCREHRPQQEVKAVPAPDTTCIMCMDPVGDCVSYGTMVCPACEHAWFHRACVQEQAMNAGILYFDCPLCRDICFFVGVMRKMGIRIPPRFPTWENEDKFEPEPRSHSRCDASECRYRYGREEAARSG
ncbi:hypothetical protein ASZ78_002961, partial [Callipepla squamata]